MSEFTVRMTPRTGGETIEDYGKLIMIYLSTIAGWGVEIFAGGEERE